MESTGPIEKASEPPSFRWANFLGIFIAVLTLTIPALAIVHYSSYNRVDPLSDTPHSVTRSDH